MQEWGLNSSGMRNFGIANFAKGVRKRASLSDEALLSRYSTGDAKAFETLYRRHKQGLFAFLRRQCDNHALAEELAHDTWLAVIHRANPDTASDSSGQKTDAPAIVSFKAWLYRVAHNRMVDYWRKHGSNAPAVFEELREHSGLLDDSSAQGLEFDAIVAHFETLSSAQLSTLLLKIEGFSHREIAEITLAKPEAVKSRLRYATKTLRGAMQATLKV